MNALRDLLFLATAIAITWIVLAALDGCASPPAPVVHAQETYSLCACRATCGNRGEAYQFDEVPFDPVSFPFVDSGAGYCYCRPP